MNNNLNISFEIIESSFETEIKQTINARELHEKLGVKKDFSDWFKTQIKRGMFDENIDFIAIPLKGEGEIRKNSRGLLIDSTGKILQIDYFLTIDTAKHIALMSGTQKGKEIRQYFIELEKEFYKLFQKENLQPAQASQDFDIKSYTQQNRDLIELIKLINSENMVTLHYLDKLTKQLNLKSPLDLLQIDLNSYYFIPTELGKFLNKSAVEINKILEKKGFQEKINGVWQLTDSGKKYAIQLDNNFKTIKWKLESLA
jgi:phage anti-repressor protein